VRAVERVSRQLRRTLERGRANVLSKVKAGAASEAKSRAASRKESSRDKASSKGEGEASEASGVSLSDEQERELLISILAGYPDRVARRRAPAAATHSAQAIGAREDEMELLLSGGGAALLAPESVVRRAEFLVAVDAEERVEGARVRAAKTVVRLASAIEPDWLLDLFADSLSEKVEARWNAQGERVEVVRRLVYDQLTVDEWRGDRAARGERGVVEELTRVLVEAALDAGPEAFASREEIENFLARVEFVARTFPEENFRALGEEDVRGALVRMCEGRQSFAELREAARAGELIERLRARLTPEQSRLVAPMAPERVALARGRQVRVRYEMGKTPHVASRLQDFFGMREGPKVAGGRVAVVLHLLAPSQRPVQVTTDLAGFWSRHYPRVRRELGRRYPRHAWPEDPLEG